MHALRTVSKFVNPTCYTYHFVEPSAGPTTAMEISVVVIAVPVAVGVLIMIVFIIVLVAAMWR